MIIVSPMGRKKLNRERVDLTLPSELKQRAVDVATSEGRPLSHLVEGLLRPYIEQHWKPQAKGKRK